jgi:hypothetical protein
MQRNEWTRIAESHDGFIPVPSWLLVVIRTACEEDDPEPQLANEGIWLHRNLREACLRKGISNKEWEQALRLLGGRYLQGENLQGILAPAPRLYRLWYRLRREGGYLQEGWDPYLFHRLRRVLESEEAEGGISR